LKLGQCSLSCAELRYALGNTSAAGSETGGLLKYAAYGKEGQNARLSSVSSFQNDILPYDDL